MLKIYNSQYLNNRQRLLKSILIGIVVALVCGYLCGLISIGIGMRSSVFALLIAYLVSLAIHNYGCSVENKVIIVGGICCLIGMLMYDYVALYGNNFYYLLHMPFEVFKTLLSVWLNFSMNGLFGLIMRCLGLYYGALNSRGL